MSYKESATTQRGEPLEGFLQATPRTEVGGNPPQEGGGVYLGPGNRTGQCRSNISREGTSCVSTYTLSALRYRGGSGNDQHHKRTIILGPEVLSSGPD